MKGVGVNCLIGFVFTGCLYVHSPEREKVALDAQTAFNDAVAASPATNPMKTRAARREALEALARELHRVDEQIAAEAFLSNTWKDLIASTTTAHEEARSTIPEIEKDLAEREAVLKESLEAIAIAGKGTRTLADALNAASRAAAEHAATQDLLTNALTAFVDDKPQSYADLKAVLKTPKEYQAFTIADDGTVSTTTKSLLIGDLIGVDPSALPDGPPKSPQEIEAFAAKISGLAKFDSALGLRLKNPGIVTTIIGLGLDVARARETRLRADIATAKQQIKLHKQLRKLLNARKAGLEANLRQLASFRNTFSAPDDETLRTTVEKLAEGFRADRKSNEARGLESLLSELAVNYRHRVVARADIDILTDRITSFDTDRALTVAATNLAEREAVVGRGLEGLVAFQKGGLNEGDSRRLVGLAQAIGIFSLGGL